MIHYIFRTPTTNDRRKKGKMTDDIQVLTVTVRFINIFVVFFLWIYIIKYCVHNT